MTLETRRNPPSALPAALICFSMIASAASTAAQEAQGPLDLFVAYTRTQLQATGFSRQQAEIGGEPLVWWEKGEGPTLVMIHGVADQAGTWFLVAPKLAESRRVLLVDLPGHGDSGPASGPLPMTTVVTGFESWLASHGIEAGKAPPVLVGNSMGAWVAMTAARRHPELVSRVVAVNGGPLRADTGDLDLFPADREEARRLMAALRDPGSPPTPDFVLDDLVRRVPGGRVSRMFEAREDLESYLLDDGRLGEIKTPVDVLWGESDRYMGREYPDRLVAGLVAARLTLIAKCGHLPQAECPLTFADKLAEVLAADPPVAAPKE
jgi:pimeloyl-ACP methyl ester carboxylesterase